ncbi:hypothetical protein SVIOM342S_06477 [Streptomyces violaceorubidus]
MTEKAHAEGHAAERAGAWSGSWVAERLGVELAGDEALTGLLGLALRRNPKRAHLLVSNVLGKHVPQSPSVVHGHGVALGRRVRDLLGTEAAESAVVLGYAETATGLGHLVADGLGPAPYLHSTRRPVTGVARAGGFEESHSHATSHLLLPEDPALLAGDGPLVLVDDEFSTGNTVLNTIRALHERYPRKRYVVVALVDMRSPADAGRLDDFAREIGARVDLVTTASGTVHLPPGVLEKGQRTGRPPRDGGHGAGRPRSGRHAVRSRRARRTALAPRRPRRRTARIHRRPPGPAGGRPARHGGTDRRGAARRRPPGPRPRLRGTHVRPPPSGPRPGADPRRRRHRALLHHHPLSRPRRRRPRLRHTHPPGLPRARRPGRRPRRALRLQRRGRRLRRRRRRRRLGRRHPGAARPGRTAGPARRPRPARPARGRPVVRPASPARPRKALLHAARAPARPRLLLVRARRGRLAAPGPLGRDTGGADRGARGGDPERRRALRGVAARGVPAQRAVPAAVPRGAGDVRRTAGARRRRRHRDRPRGAVAPARPGLPRPRGHPRRRSDAPLGAVPPWPRPPPLRRVDRPGPRHRRQRAALAGRSPRPRRRRLRRRLDRQGRHHPRTGRRPARVRGVRRHHRLRPGDRRTGRPRLLRAHLRHPRRLPHPLRLPQLHRLRTDIPHRAPRRPGRPARLPRREVLPRTRRRRPVTGLPRRRLRPLPRRHGHGRRPGEATSSPPTAAPPGRAGPPSSASARSTASTT